MRRHIIHVIILTLAMYGPTPSHAADIYAAFEGFIPFGGNTFGVASFNAETMQFENSFLTSSQVTALGYLNGSLYDIENGQVFQRNPATGALTSGPISADSGGYTGLAALNGVEYAVGNNGLDVAILHPLTNGSLGVTFGLSQTAPASGITAGNGKLFETFNDSLLVTVPVGNSSVTSTAGGSGGTTLGSLVYNGDSNIVQAAVDLLIPDTSVQFKGVIDFRASDGSVIVNIIFPAGLDLGYEPSGLAFGLHSLYASELGNIRRLDPANGAVVTESGPQPVLFGALLFVPGPGDYNQNGIVDAADYVVWRKGLGTTYTQTDYDVWRAHFGQTAGSGLGASVNAAVPEPATVALLIVGILAMSSARRVIVP
jgi:hypothetical protein